jgi:shikimate kinase
MALQHLPNQRRSIGCFVMKNIFLIGMPSSGKTTVGKILARHLRYRFIDTDALIEKNEGMNVADIFKIKGESYFREAERDILRAIRPHSKLMVSTGGGMPCFFDGIDFIKKNGISIYLNVKPEELLKRILNHRNNDRPLYNKESDDLLHTLEQKYTLRLPIYSQADYQIEVTQPLPDLIKTLTETLAKNENLIPK